LPRINVGEWRRRGQEHDVLSDSLYLMDGYHYETYERRYEYLAISTAGPKLEASLLKKLYRGEIMRLPNFTSGL
jgi:hypothetical protein